MKTTKRLLSCLLVLAMLFALAIPAFAADGSNKITVTEAAIGEDYKLIKLFDATQVEGRDQDGDGIVYTGNIPESLKPYFTENATTKEITANEATLSNEAIEAITAWAKGYTGTKDVDVWTQTAKSNTVVFDNLPDGYYVVVSEISQTGGVISVTSATPNATVADKNTGDGPEKPDGDKKVKTIVDAAGDHQTQASADLGAEVKFSVEFKGGNYFAKEVTENDETKTVRTLVTYYTVVDTPVDMTLSEKAHVKIATDPVKEFDVDIKDGKIVIPWAENGVSLYPNKVDVTVTYTGTITGSNASNTAVVNPNGENEGGTTPEDPVKVYTSSIIVDKVLKEGNDLVPDTKIPGAKFVLTKTVEEDGKNVIKYYSYDEATKTVSWNATYTEDDVKTTDINGKVEFVGLADGDYELVEIEAPAGYNKLADPVKVTVNAVEETTVNGETVHKISYTEQIGNSKGTVLPSTGGIGTTMFYVVGGLLVAAAVVVLVSKKRMGAEQ